MSGQVDEDQLGMAEKEEIGLLFSALTLINVCLDGDNSSGWNDWWKRELVELLSVTYLFQQRLRRAQPVA